MGMGSNLSRGSDIRLLSISLLYGYWTTKFSLHRLYQTASPLLASQKVLTIGKLNRQKLYVRIYCTETVKRPTFVSLSWLKKLSSIRHNVFFYSLLSKPLNYYLIPFSIHSIQITSFLRQSIYLFLLLHPNQYMMSWQISKQLQYRRIQSARETNRRCM